MWSEFVEGAEILQSRPGRSEVFMLHLYHAFGPSGCVPLGGQAGTEGLCASHQRWEQDGPALPRPPEGSGM